MRHPIRAFTIGVLAVALVATGCSKNVGSAGENVTRSTVTKVVHDTKGEAKTPAAEVPGAKKGGTIHILQPSDFEFLDPQSVYVSNAITAASQLFHRALTGYIEDPKSADVRLVGDLATNVGESSDGGKTWTYKLREGISFEDGAPITSKDIAYGVARSFSEFGDNGPQYIANWLQPARTYKGPYGGANKLPPGVTTPDDKTIVFSFPEPHPDFPLAAAMTTTTPVPEAKDTKSAYNFAFVSTGPYKIKAGSYKKDQGFTLVRNSEWDPKTDPIRHQYPDEYVFDNTVTDADQTQRVLADTGKDQTAVMVENVPVEMVAQVKNDSDAQGRIMSGPTPYVRWIAINTQRVKDVEVRKGLNYAFDRDSYIKTIGGSTAGDPATTILAPSLPGYVKYDAYPGSKSGDPEKARELFKGKSIKPLNYCFANSPTAQKVSAGVKVGLERAGITVNLQPIDRSAFYKTVGRKDTTCDLMTVGWGWDYPDASTFIPPLFDGTIIRQTGNQNWSYLNDPAVNAKIKELNAEPDREKAAKGYADLDKALMEQHAPAIPTVYDRFYALIGSKVGGAHMTPLYGQTSYVNLYVK